MIINRRLSNVIVPMDAQSMDNLTVNSDDGIYGYISLSREDVTRLIRSGLFDFLNKSLQLDIDEWEEEDVTDQQKLLLLHEKISDFYYLFRPTDSVVVFYIKHFQSLVKRR
jgi:hypothetical protein